MAHEIFTFRNLKLLLQDSPTPDIIKLLSNTIWGTPGGANYKHYGTAEKVKTIQQTKFVALRKNEKLLGTFALVGRTQKVQSVTVPAWYIRYFSLEESLRLSQPQDRPETNKKKVKDNLLKRQMSRYFDNPVGLSYPDASHEQSIYYAYVELTNERSQQMCASMGFQPIRKFSTLPFSRFSPKSDPRVRLTRPKEFEKIRKITRDFYAEYSFYLEDELVSGKGHYVLEENGEIVAGLRAHPARWEIRNLPGFTGKMIVKMLPHIPFIKRIFNPSDFRFLALQGIFHAPGKEALLPILIESVLAKTGYHTALTWADTQSQIIQSLKKAGKMGFLSKLQKDVPADVIIRFRNIAPEDQQAFHDRPVYISGYDPL